MPTDDLIPTGVNATTGQPDQAITPYSPTPPGTFVRKDGDTGVQVISRNNDTVPTLLNASNNDPDQLAGFQALGENNSLSLWAIGTSGGGGAPLDAAAAIIAQVEGAAGKLVILANDVSNNPKPVEIRNGAGGVNIVGRWTENGFAPTVFTPAVIGANTNDYVVNLTADITRLRASIPVNITGIVAPVGASESALIRLVNVGLNAITITNDDAASVAANRILNSTGANVALSPNESATYWYDFTDSRWRTIS